MSGQGKYTVYAPESNAKNNLLAKLFPNSPTAQYVGKEVDYRSVVVSQGNENLKKGLQAGDSYFGPGVDMDYSGSPNVLSKSDGAWQKPGDPANSFTPDLTSPGPGKTEGTDKNSDPQIKSSDIKPTYVPGGPNTGTRNPAEYAKKIASQILGADSKIKLGSSDSTGS
jgi:hypothetical protein